MDARLRAQALIEFGLPRNWLVLVIERLRLNGAENLTSNELYMILKRAGNLLRAESSVLHIHCECRVIGNLYGRVESLQTIFSRFGWPSDTCYVFLGDYISIVDGQLKIDLLMLLLVFKIVYPKRILLLRGLSECEHCAAELGLIDLLGATYSMSLYEVVKDVFKYLPLAAQVNSVYLLSNSSLNLDRGNLADLELVVRPCTTCVRGRNIQVLGLQTPRKSARPDDEEIVRLPILNFLKKSGLLVSIRDADNAVPDVCGCDIQGSGSNVIHLVSTTSLDGKPYNGIVLAIHTNSACTFHSADPRLAKPPIRLIMPRSRPNITGRLPNHILSPSL